MYGVADAGGLRLIGLTLSLGTRPRRMLAPFPSPVGVSNRRFIAVAGIVRNAWLNLAF